MSDIINYRIDLYSDTKTRPSPEMREFMIAAEVGDEQAGEDPTVNKLVEMFCERLGKEDGLFLPTGTMCNQVAIRTHCESGDEIIGDKTVHVRNNETGGPAAHSGALIYPIEGKRGVFTPDQFKEAIRPVSNYMPISKLVVIEQTSNSGGGTIWPIAYIEEISKIALENNIVRHMDGARLFNAVVKEGISEKRYADNFDSVWVDLSKGLGCPLGGVLTGSKEFIHKARRFKHQFGGAMRQAGIVAAAGIYALNHNIDRMAEDHKNADILAEHLQKIDGIKVEPVGSNMVFFDISGLQLTANEFNDLLKPHSLRFSVSDNYRMRAVTHLDVNTEQIYEAIEIIKKVLP